MELTAERARIFRITHIDNVPWILTHGLRCGSSNIRDPNFVQIGNPDLITKRESRTVPEPPGGTLHEYVPFSKFERYQAEALVYQHLPVERLNGVVCHGAAEETRIQGMMEETAVACPVAARPLWFV